MAFPRSSSSGSLSDNEEVFQGYSLYETRTSEDYADPRSGGFFMNCGVQPDRTRPFQDRVEELLRQRMLESARSPKRHCGERRSAAAADAEDIPRPAEVTPETTPVCEGKKTRERFVSYDVEETSGIISSSSSCGSSDGQRAADFEAESTPPSRTSSASRLEMLLKESASAEGETPQVKPTSGGTQVTPFVLGEATAPFESPRLAAFRAAEALLRTH